MVSPATNRDASLRAILFRRTKLKTLCCSESQRSPCRIISWIPCSSWWSHRKSHPKVVGKVGSREPGVASQAEGRRVGGAESPRGNRTKILILSAAKDLL